ncbi:MAG: antibiotic biosynthesis monooxygenase [Rubrobacter sp.]|nr:antibiotic biosynthesis monooxygenase [Rubrobacter sp.]
MSKVTFFVRMIAKEGKAEEVGETLRINFSNVQQEKGNVVFVLHRLAENPDEFWIYETW